MSEKTGKTIRLCTACVISAMTVILGILLVWQVLDAYFTGASSGGKFIFTQTDLFARFNRVSPAFWLWVVTIIAGFVIWEVFPVAVKKGGYKDPRYTLARLKKRIPAAVGEELNGSFEFVKKQERLIKILWLCCAVLGTAGIIYTIVYLAIPSHFPKTDVTHEVIKMAGNVLPWAGVTFVTACGVTFYEGISAKKQLEHAVKLAAGNKPVETTHGGILGKIYEITHHKYFLLGVRIAVGCLAVAFIIAGSLNGNVANVFIKDGNIH